MEAAGFLRRDYRGPASQSGALSCCGPALLSGTDFLLFPAAVPPAAFSDEARRVPPTGRGSAPGAGGRLAIPRSLVAAHDYPLPSRPLSCTSLLRGAPTCWPSAPRRRAGGRAISGKYQDGTSGRARRRGVTRPASGLSRALSWKRRDFCAVTALQRCDSAKPPEVRRPRASAGSRPDGPGIGVAAGEGGVRGRSSPLPAVAGAEGPRERLAGTRLAGGCAASAAKETNVRSSRRVPERGSPVQGSPKLPSFARTPPSGDGCGGQGGDG